MFVPQKNKLHCSRQRVNGDAEDLALGNFQD
jgi:hypothetical protein